MATSTVEKEIDNYLSLLNQQQKETILEVVKTIATAKQEYDKFGRMNHLKKWKAGQWSTKIRRQNCTSLMK